jgi:ketosteroid isomerase-like protein
LKSTLYIALIILCSSFGVSAQAASKNAAALKSLVKQMTDAQLAYDATALDKLFTSDYIEISPLGEFDPRDKVLGFYKPEMKPDAAKMSASLDINDYSIREYGDSAIVIAKFDYKMSSEGKELPPRSIRAMVICRREKGSWKIASTQYTGIRPPAKPQS